MIARIAAGAALAAVALTGCSAAGKASPGPTVTTTVSTTRTITGPPHAVPVPGPTVTRTVVRTPVVRLDNGTDVWVYLDNAGEPTLVNRTMIHEVHGCDQQGNCLATMVGNSKLVWVRGSDFGQ